MQYCMLQYITDIYIYIPSSVHGIKGLPYQKYLLPFPVSPQEKRREERRQKKRCFCKRQKKSGHPYIRDSTHGEWSSSQDTVRNRQAIWRRSMVQGYPIKWIAIYHALGQIHPWSQPSMTYCSNLTAPCQGLPHPLCVLSILESTMQHHQQQ